MMWSAGETGAKKSLDVSRDMCIWFHFPVWTWVVEIITQSNLDPRARIEAGS